MKKTPLLLATLFLSLAFASVVQAAGMVNVTPTQSHQTEADFTVTVDSGDELVLQENQAGFCSVDGTIDNDNSGFTGSGFANTTNEDGVRIIWRVNAQNSGTYALDWRYANGGSTSRNATVYAGSEQADMTFPSTGSWTSWTNDVADIYLNAGENSITLVAGTSSGLPNIDSLSIAGSGISGIDCAESDEDEDGDISISDTAPGWASENGGTTGGGTDIANAVTVSSMSALQSEVSDSSSRIILVEPGTYDGELSVGANKTIMGTEPGVTIHGNVKISGSDSYNVILRNMAVRGLTCDSYDECRAGSDAMYIGGGAHHVWVDHLDIADGQDGNLDITRAADYVTVSWTKFHYTYDKEHRFSNLIAGSDDETDSQGKLKITYMNCWWDSRVESRQPRGRFGDIHMLNNYHNTGGGQIHGVGYDMALIAENCYYDEPDQTIFTDMGSPRGWLGTGNAGSASNMNDSNGSVFSIPYSYSAIPASEVKAAVTATNSGAGNTCQLAE
jgi:pectate lyase